jgi:predicted membrane protein
VGKLTIYLPSDVGVMVDVELGIAAIDTRGLQKDGNTYTNDAYGESAVTLRIEIEGGIGDIRLEVRE